MRFFSDFDIYQPYICLPIKEEISDAMLSSKKYILTTLTEKQVGSIIQHY